ncbi:ACT domain-containing protein [Planococcus beigongshangi]|uniref:ACT domain-containing protein n=1 Tax=Planococcus beigongshangi TaxID=2782536 RepID=UPI001EED37D5|nr:ACT domain-containing protein [Planococcus beigongshangi]
MKDISEQRFFLVREDVLTEAMQKTLEVKKMLQRADMSIQEAVDKTGLSRSAFYKYRDAVFPFHSIVKERILTIFLQLEDRTGTLATLIQAVAEARCNILTIHQTIPIQGRANVTLSLDVTAMDQDLDVFLQQLKKLDFVEAAEVVSSGSF